MIVYTDSPHIAEKLFPGLKGLKETVSFNSDFDKQIAPLLERFFRDRRVYQTTSEIHRDWHCAFIVDRALNSQFDQMVDLVREEMSLPDRIICLAEHGEKFHGQRGRPWSAVSGNIHLTAFFKPEQNIEYFHAGFPALAAVSVRETINSIPGLKNRAAIKWVNDILIDQAKVAGFIAHSQVKGDLIRTAVMGIGINVETMPEIIPDPFVSKVTSLCSHLSDLSVCNQSIVLEKLLKRLHKNFLRLCKGQAFKLVAAYRKHSLVLGKDVEIFSDSPGKERIKIAEGKVRGIGNNLELMLEGREKPITHGRVVLKI